jgi:hypothetical protein
MSMRSGVGAALMMSAAVLLGGSEGHAQPSAKAGPPPSLQISLPAMALKCSSITQVQAKAVVKNEDSAFGAKAFDGNLRFGSTLLPIAVAPGKAEAFNIDGDALNCLAPLKLSVSLLPKNSTQPPIVTRSLSAKSVDYDLPSEKFKVPGYDGFLGLTLPATATGKGFACGQPMQITVTNKLVKEGKPAAMKVGFLTGFGPAVPVTYPGNSTTQGNLGALQCDKGVPGLIMQAEGNDFKIPVALVQF